MIRATVISIVSCVVVFSVGEISVRILASSDDALHATQHILVEDTDVLWRQRANLDTTFLGLPLITDGLGFRTQKEDSKTSKLKTLLILGPSSTFGWGVRTEDTYSSQLQKISSTSGVHVVNGGEIGYSTAQGVRLLTDSLIEAVDPQIIVLAYGINDLDRYRFYYQDNTSDSEEFSKKRSPFAAIIRNVLGSSELVTALSKIATHMIAKQAPFATSSDNGSALPKRRVSSAEIYENVSEMIAAASRHHAQAIVLSTSVYLPVSTSTPEVDAAAQRHYDMGLAAKKRGDLNQAMVDFQASAEVDSFAADSLYEMSDIEHSHGDNTQAEKNFNLAREKEPYRISRDIAELNATLESAARDAHIPFGNIDTWFDARDRSKLFVDPIHFSSEGNTLVAKGIESILTSTNMLANPQ